MPLRCMRPLCVLGLVKAEYYTTISPANTNLCIDVPGGSAYNGNMLWLWECNGGDSQIWVWDNWEMRYAADERFCIDPTPSPSDGLQLWLWECGGWDQQRWGWNNGAVYSDYGGQCMDWYDGWYDNGQPLHIWTCNAQSNQQWSLVDSGAPSGGGGGGGDPCGSKKFGMYQVEIGSHCVYVDDKGAKGDDSHDDTEIIQAAIQEVVDNGGGTVIFGEKTYRVTQLDITGDHVQLHLPENGRVKFHKNEKVQFGSYLMRFAGSGDSHMRKHVAITGAGTWDGQGSPKGWWREELKKSGGDRPHMFDASHAAYCYFEQARFINCPGHCMEMYCDHTEMSDVTILAPPSNTADNTYAVEGVHGPSHNTDGVDVHGDPFYIHGCYFSVGDDNVAIHASNVLIEDSWFYSGHGASIGSLGDDRNLRNITVRRVTFKDTEQGARIKTNAGANYGKSTHSELQDVHFEDLIMYGVRKTLYINMFYDTDKHGEWVDTDFKIHDIHFDRITAYGTQNYLGKAVTPGYLDCQPSNPCYDIHFNDISHPDLDSSASWNMCRADFSSHNVQPKSSGSPCLHPEPSVVV